MPKTSRLRVLALSVVLLILAGLACIPSNGDQAPTVTITSPASGTTVEVGELVEIVSMAAADAGVANVILSVNAQEIRQDPPPSGNPTSFSVAQPWTPVVEGEVTISVVAIDADDNESEAAVITLRVVPSVAGGGDTEPEATATSAPDVTGEGGCTLNASFVADVTIPDDTEMAPGTPFVKTWRLRNTGTCNWEAGFEFFFVSGDQLGGPTSVAAPATAAGSSADLSVNLVAESTPGTYRGYWRMRSDTGLAFGSTVYVQIVVPAPTPEPTVEPTPEPTAEPTVAPTPVEEDIVADRDSFWWPQFVMCMPGNCPDWGNEPVLELLNHVTGDPPFQLLDAGMIAIHFDLGVIPEGATILEATLFLRLESSEGSGAASISVRRATSPWSEADHAVKPICEGSGGSSRNVGTGTGWYDWDVTDIVAQQYASPTANHGFCLRGGNAEQERNFHSREGNAVTRPYLHVVYLP